jgi:hypothetical protein
LRHLLRLLRNLLCCLRVLLRDTGQQANCIIGATKPGRGPSRGYRTGKRAEEATRRRTRKRPTRGYAGLRRWPLRAAAWRTWLRGRLLLLLRWLLLLLFLRRLLLLLLLRWLLLLLFLRRLLLLLLLRGWLLLFLRGLLLAAANLSRRWGKFLRRI